MKKRKIVITATCIFLAALMVFSVLMAVIGSVSASAVTNAEIDSLKDDAAELEEKKNELQAQIDELEGKQADAMAQKTVLDEKVSVIESEIANVVTQIAGYAELISQKEVELSEAEKAEDKQFELYKTRVRAMEENGSMSYLSIILGAQNFSDLLTRIDMITSVMEYDKRVEQELEQARIDVENAKEKLEIAKADEEAAQAELEVKKEELDVQVAEADAVVAALEADLGVVMDSYEDNKAKIDEIDAEIERLTEELKKQQEEGTGTGGGGTNSGVTSTDRFLWPAAPGRVTSLFGTRLHPIYNYYRTHNGIDIGPGYGTNIYASENGTVIVSGYDAGGYGNYVVLSHSGGYTTLYAHMSQRLVSVGEVVSQGDVIGLVGSTGASTGPHLHFEIMLNGVRKNPLDYFTGYVISPSAW